MKEIVVQYLNIVERFLKGKYKEGENILNTKYCIKLFNILYHLCKF